MTPPNRMPPGERGRQKNVATTHASLSGEGRTKAARPVNPNQRRAGIYVAPGTPPVTLGTAGTQAVSISATVSGPGNSNAAGGSVAVGDLADASGVNSTVVGRDGSGAGDYSVRVGFAGSAGGAQSTSVGEGAASTGARSGAVGAAAAATAAGSWALGSDSGGGSATATGINDFVLGTSNHNVSVPGKFGVHGATPVAQSATPTTLADVIAILQSHGFCA